jgi:hypothetical protein
VLRVRRFTSKTWVGVIDVARLSKVLEVPSEPLNEIDPELGKDEAVLEEISIWLNGGVLCSVFSDILCEVVYD